ncbi:hypothetical protein ACIO8F_29635 [Streptomyces sp. NPDC087228]|uniref:hypothetical protein n=1 Tax=Streptomyces sp. NPDC087228 TaxID=3365772 RepID=UPI0038284D4D
MRAAGLWPPVWTDDTHPVRRRPRSGWSVNASDEIVEMAHPLYPSPELPYKVLVCDAQHCVVDETHYNGAPSRGAWGWCTNQEDAAEAADALVATRTVWDTTPRGGAVEVAAPAPPR